MLQQPWPSTLLSPGFWALGWLSRFVTSLWGPATSFSQSHTVSSLASFQSGSSSKHIHIQDVFGCWTAKNLAAYFICHLLICINRLLNVIIINHGIVQYFRVDHYLYSCRFVQLKGIVKHVHKADNLIFSECEVTAGSVLFDEAYIRQYFPVDWSSNQQGQASIIIRASKMCVTSSEKAV